MQLFCVIFLYPLCCNSFRAKKKLKKSVKIFGAYSFLLYIYIIRKTKKITIKNQSKMKNLLKTLKNKKTGYGHFIISIEMDGQEFKTTTTNTMAIDAAFDDCYDDNNNSGCYYESREEAQSALVNEILWANKIEL